MTLDTQIFYLLHGLAGQSPLLDWLILFFASYFPYLVVAGFLILLAAAASPRREKIRVLLVVGGSALIARLGAVEAIRFFYHRPRPFTAFSFQPLFPDTAWSFPSGHAAFFFALATAVYLYNKKWGVGFFVAATFISVSRVAAGVHYPSDVLAGALLGALIAYIVFKIAKYWEQKTLNQTS